MRRKKTRSPKPVAKTLIPATNTPPQINPTVKRRMTPIGLIVMVIVTVVLDIILWQVYINTEDATVATASFWVMVIFTGIMSLQIIYYLIKYGIKLLAWLFKKGLQKPLIVLPIVFVLFIVVLLGIYFFKKAEFTRDQYLLDLIHDQMSSAGYLKSVGDSIVILNKPVLGWGSIKIKEVGTEAQNNLFDISSEVQGTKLEGYYYSTLTWLLEIETGTTDKESWAKVISLPPEFTISLNDQDLEMAIKKSIKTVMDLKEFSELAISKNDKEAMRFIAARLLTQLNWLENLAYSEDAGFFAEGIGISTVHAAESRVIRNCGFLACKKLPNLNKLVRGVWSSAHNYSVGEPSTISTTEAWTGLENGLPDAGIPLGGAGLQIGPDQKTMISPRSEEFYANCRTRGGTIGGTGGVKTRLPTTESGETCWMDGGKCWDFLTYSGGRYKGGENNCEEMGLVPRPNVINIALAEVEVLKDNLSLDNLTGIFTNIISNKWDGEYNAKFSGTACSGFEQNPYFNANTFLASYINHYSQIVVSGNRVQGFETGGYIDESGQTITGITVSESGTSATLRMDLQFSGSDQARTVSGMFYITMSLPGSNIRCSSNISGT